MVLLAFLLSCGAAPQDAPTPATLTGDWGGWVEFAGNTTWLQLRARGEAVLLYDFNADMSTREARSFSLDDGRLRFVYEAGIGDVVFEGEVADGIALGTLRAEGFEDGRFELTRFHDLPAGRSARHVGRYETVEGRVYWVVPRTFGGVRIASYEGEGTGFADYWFDAWLPWKDDEYREAVLGRAALPPPRTIAFEEDRMVLSGEGGFTAYRTAAVRPVSFESGDLTLHGWLLLPPGDGPRPAIAFAHGSGYVSADSFFDLYTAVRLVRHLDVAVLRWDKRGVWNSDGDQGLSSYHELADDVLAAVDCLRTQEGVDPDRVGIGGISQGPSWPLPIAAAQSRDVAFVVATSGSVDTIAATNVFNWTTKMRREGHSDEHVQEAKAFFDEALRLATDPTPSARPRVDAFLREHRGEPWYPRAKELVGLDSPLDGPRAARWRRIAYVDPVDYWREVTCPVFQTWGADDPLVDARLSSSRMADMVSATGQENFTSIVYPSPEAHGVGRSRTSTYFDDLARWFAEHFGER